MGVMLLFSFSCLRLMPAEQCGGSSSLGTGGPCRTEGPATPQQQPAWLASMQADRAATNSRTGYAGGVFDVPALAWTRTAWVQPQFHPFDRFFYSRETKNYTVRRYLDDLDTRYGGIDAALMWPTYPNLGADDRNQFDLYRAMPGGLAAIRRVTRELNASGVRLLWAYLHWDTETRREPLSDEQTIVQMLKQTGGAGINGDSLPFVPESFYNESVRQDYPIALQAEGGTRDAALNWSTLGWGYWGRQSNPGDAAGYHWTYKTVPLVDRFKFLTSGQYLTTICERYAKNRTDDLQLAFFNGDGYESWENVWGSFNALVPRDGEALRRVGMMLRYWGARGFLHSNDWEPHALGPTQYGVYASRWPLPDSSSSLQSSSSSATLWTLVNRAGHNLTGAQLRLSTIPSSTTTYQYYDCYHGVELKPEFMSASRHSGGEEVMLSFPMEAGGFGCVLEVGSPRTSAAAVPNHSVSGAALQESGDAAERLLGQLPGLGQYLSTMRETTNRSLASFDAQWRIQNQTMVATAPTAKRATAPSGMVTIPAGNFTFKVSSVVIEGDDAVGSGFQNPWEPAPQKKHSHKLELGPFFIDRFPVTCANYSNYLAATGYVPEDPHNFLANWPPSPTAQDHVIARQPGPALADVPVTYVGIEEARLYCAWAHNGSRLPQSYEWQYAAQGVDGRQYPWGNTKDQSRFPKTQGGKTMPGAARVDAFSPAGASPFGVEDLVGNTWEWTSEFVDAHTSRAALRGGANYNLHSGGGGGWYFPQALELDKENKYLLMDNSYDRCGTIGFRCVVDAQ